MEKLSLPSANGEWQQCPCKFMHRQSRTPSFSIPKLGRVSLLKALGHYLPWESTQWTPTAKTSPGRALWGPSSIHHLCYAHMLLVGSLTQQSHGLGALKGLQLLFTASRAKNWFQTWISAHLGSIPSLQASKPPFPPNIIHDQKMWGEHRTQAWWYFLLSVQKYLQETLQLHWKHQLTSPMQEIHSQTPANPAQRDEPMVLWGTKQHWL